MEKPPKLTQELLNKAFKLYSRKDIYELVVQINDKYLYWSDIKYKSKQVNISAEELWAVVKLSRLLQRINIWPKYNISLLITNKMQSLCHSFDMNFGGSWGSQSIIPSEEKERCLISSSMEEAISSSQMEGAATTRKVAKDMLRKNISPRNRGEQMISNNYDCIRYISEHKDEPLTEEMLLKIHSLMTAKTLENPEDAGRFRSDDNVYVVNHNTSEVVHYPPTYTDIPEFIHLLCSFANDSNEGYFIHPIIRAIIIHFMIAYVHPFSDGNGRTARAVFYWYMLKNKYWLTEYMSISRIIYKTKASYENAYLYTENDDNDISYFVSYHLKVLEQAFDELKIYIEKKIDQKAKTADFLRLGGINERQAAMLSIINNNPQTAFTIKELENRFAVSHPTVKADVDALVARGLLSKIAINKVKSSYIKGEQFDTILKSLKK